MIESFKQLEEAARERDLAEVFLEADEQEHGVPRDQILEALRKRRQVMRDCVERGKGGGLSTTVDPEKTVRALVVAGGIGSIIALSANISGAAGECQNEVGAASSMGAAAVAYMMGGEERSRDLEGHVRLAEIFHRAGSASRR